MGKFDDVLLASDFDNTILNTERPRRTGGPIPPVSQGNLTAIRYFMAEGGRFAVATGRALPAFRMFADKVPMNAPAIVCNGAALYDFEAETYLDSILLPEEVRAQGQAVLDRFPTAAAEAYHLDNVIHAVRPNEFTRQHQHVTHAGVEAVDDLWAVPLPLVKLMFEDEHTRLLPLRDWIFAQPWSERYEVFFSNPTLLEITGKGAGKGAMVVWLHGWGFPWRIPTALGTRPTTSPCSRRRRRALPPATAPRRCGRAAPRWWRTATTIRWLTWFQFWTAAIDKPPLSAIIQLDRRQLNTGALDVKSG